MKTSKSLSARDLFRSSLAVLIISSITSVYAGEADIAQSHTQEFTRTELNSLAPGSNFSQPGHRDKNTMVNQMNTTKHYMPGSAATGFMNQQNTANHSMSGGVIKVF